MIALQQLDFDWYPLAVPAGRETHMTIRPLGCHAAFPPSPCRIFIYYVPAGESTALCEEGEAAPGADGALHFPVHPVREGEYYVRILRPAPEDALAAECRFYALDADLAGRLPLRGDQHMHTCRSDGREDPAIVAANYRALGYDYLSITDHHRYYPSLEAIEQFRPFRTQYTLLPGEEVHLPDTEVHIVNCGGLHSVNGILCTSLAYTDVHGDPARLSLTGESAPAIDLDEYRRQVAGIAATLTDVPADVNKTSLAVCLWVFRRIREADGLSIFAHPYWLAAYGNIQHVAEPLTQYLMEHHPFDAFEVLGGENYYHHNGLQTALYYDWRARGVDMPIVGSTDSHGSTAYNRNAAICSTITFSPANERRAILSSIRDGYSVAVDTISREYRLVGSLRLQRYACFLMENWFPLHDRLCAEEGHWMKEALTGGREDAAAAMTVLDALSPRVFDLFTRYFPRG